MDYDPTPYLIEVMNILLDSPYAIEIIGEDGKVVEYYEHINQWNDEANKRFVKVIGLEFCDGHYHIIIDD